MNTIRIEYPSDLPDYTLIDSGGGEKIERFSGYTIIRPDPRAIWQKLQTDDVWHTFDAKFIRTDPDSGSWKINTSPPHSWYFHYKDCTFLLKPTDFKHVGIFPEQSVNWDWIDGMIQNHKPTILNLFAYTGGSTVVAAKKGAFVTHVDSVKSTISWAHENCKLSKVSSNSVRWIEDDAYKFVLREAKRGKIYDAIIMDPPRFGRGPHSEVWKLEEDLPKLLNACKHILSPHPIFFLLNAYTADLSSLVVKHLMENLMKNTNGTITFGELATKESSTDRLLPQGIFARWQRKDIDT